MFADQASISTGIEEFTSSSVVKNMRLRIFSGQDFYSSLRSDVRVIISLFLFLYILFAIGEWQHYSSKHKEVMSSLRILKQMQEYAKEHCKVSTKNPPNKLDNYLKVMREYKRKDITKDTVKNEVTFILLGPTVRCLSSKLSWLNTQYNGAKVLIALDLGLSAVNKQARTNMPASEGHLLGGFTNIPEALNHAIQLVSTKYFMIIDHEMDLANMQQNFIEALLTNIPGYDILSGSMVNTFGEFYIPCRRLQLHQWSYYESYQYNKSRNILQCDATSLYFIARDEAFKNLLVHKQHFFDVNLSLKWLEDFFIQFQQVLEVGVLPEVIMRQHMPSDCFNTQPSVISASKHVELILPFAKKHQLFYISNGTNYVDVCKHSKNLACSERGIQRDWGTRHWTDGGLTTYPFIIESLKKALHFGTKRLEESHLMYVIEGGTLLGMVKVRDIMPWDHGDIDTFVYATRRKVINMVKESLRDYGYEFWLHHSGFHTYVTNDPTSFNGCIVYLTRRVKPKSIVFMKHQGKLFPVKRDLFRFLRQFYGSLFLENRMKVSNQRSYCTMLGHHACMPDCRWDGCGGGLDS